MTAREPVSRVRSMRETFESGGQVGADLLEVDWSRTPLGDPEQWSLSLKNAIRILLTSKFSMWMAWGPELTFFCNDAYRRDTLGTKYPWALGRRADEVWSEIWDDIGPRIARVMESGEATWDEALLLFLERSGYAEETYHTFSYSPLADDDGAVAGMLCVVTEDTQQVVATSRMALLRDLGVRMSAARDEQAAVAEACHQINADGRLLPFSVVYLFDDDGATVWRAGTAGVAGDHPVAPALIHASSPSPTWPIAELWDGLSSVVPLAGRFEDVPRGRWPEPPTEAYVVPLAQAAADHPYGFLVAGLNRYRPFDDTYRDFVDLVAGHLSAAISDARAIQAERERAEQLARLDQAKTDFFANVSHELRTPLTLLLGPAEDALADGAAPLPPSQAARLETIARNGQRMLQLVNTLLDFSRLESGQGRSSFQRTDLCVLTAELAAMFQSAAEGAGLRLDIDCDGDTVAYVDRDQWSKIVLNLISNALKFTFEGGVSVTIGSDDGEAVLRVSDTGTGIPEADQPRLFERFHRVAGSRSRTHEGSGIGLALVAELVNAHGGTVSVDSAPGEGSTFVVRLPLGHEHLPAEQVAHESGTIAVAADGATRSMVAQALSWLPDGSQPEPRAAARSGQPTVLVVDDNADMRSYIADLLHPEYDVQVAADGIDALERMAERRPDLVLTDVMMPRLDGFGLLHKMQGDPALTSVPVIMLSARAGEEGTLEGLEAGANDYLVKPFSGRELLARVRVNLELDREQRVRQALERSEELLAQAQRLAQIGSWEIHLDQDTITASPMFYELMHMSAEEMDRLGTARVIESLVHPDDLERVNLQIAHAVPGEIVRYETRVVLPDGRVRLFQARGELATDPAGGRVLRGSFQDITDQRATQERLIAAEAEREAATRERLIAEQLQASLLPQSEFDLDSLDVAAFYRAGVEGTYVGGDWYDVIPLGAGRTAFVIGDVMGRGVRAASVMGQLRSAVRAYAALDLTPVEVLELLDRLVQELGSNQIVTCVYAVHDAADRTLTYANAGHPPPLLARHDLVDNVARIEATGPPLGAGYFGMRPEVVALEADDLVVLYTDGLVERRGTDLFDGIERLAEAVRDHVDHDLAELPAMLAHDLLGGEVDDDIALVLVKVAEPEDPGLQVRLDSAETAARQARRAVRLQLAAWGVPEELAEDLVLVTSELVTNAFVHARPPIDLRIRRTHHEVVLEVHDRALLRPRRRRPDDDDEHGRGLNIVEALTTDWGTRSSESGKTVWCTVRV
ncbi:SpoIIE family protein phosphatase [Nocardioides sp. MAH-18]|uniref:histidine kinase n=1 Tax=Nocardioides agri TaxID=2682843 RepID=A0A6L6XRS3_9ACTN|nr:MULTISPECIES: SpoIIE family protein phosphatase [unclassified Nocardioides]MBA2954814.1 SpoIIE family protein phosphatase [Nocardioides sp. CGMCC 1.13656]MVQ49668.1 SpoIIE family protein phosphatase [Nocardioides sp. MAH-18]